jgi:hypothetical protein
MQNPVTGMQDRRGAHLNDCSIETMNKLKRPGRPMAMGSKVSFPEVRSWLGSLKLGFDAFTTLTEGRQ